jgi:hypothetical protein
MSSDERGRKGTAAAVQWSEKVEYDGTQEFHTIKGSLNFVPFLPHWKAVFINLTAFEGEGWLAEDIRESNSTIAGRAGLSVAAVPDFNVRSIAPETITRITRQLIHDYLPIKYKFTLEWEETAKPYGKAKVPVFNSQNIYVILDRWGRATGNAQSRGYDVLWILVPPPVRTIVAYDPSDYNPFGGFPFYVDFELRSRKMAWIGPSQQLSYTTGGAVLTETQFLLMWGNAWGGGSPYFDESSPDLGMMLWYPRFGISDTQYKDEQWRDQKITHVKISNPPVWGPGSVSGPTQGIVGAQYSYTVRTTDPDGHRVTYGFEDPLYYNGTLTGDLVEANAGATATVNVVWNRPGTYRTRLMALDQFGAFSWSPLITITISVTAVTTTTPTAVTTTTPTTSTSMSHNTMTSIGLVVISTTSTQYISSTTTISVQTISGSTSAYTSTMRTSTRTVRLTTAAGGAPRTITSTRTYTTTATVTQTSWRTSTTRNVLDMTITVYSPTTSDTTVTTVTQQLPPNVLMEIIQVVRTLYVRLIGRILHNEMIVIIQLGSVARYVIITPVVEVLITVITVRYYGPLPTEPTILDTLSENAPLIAIVTVSIVAACLFVMKKRGVKLSAIRQSVTKKLTKK